MQDEFQALLDDDTWCHVPCPPSANIMAPFGWNYKPAEKHCWLIFCERKILFRLKKQAK
jgi:hypothetical protein